MKRAEWLELVGVLSLPSCSCPHFGLLSHRYGYTISYYLFLHHHPIQTALNLAWQRKNASRTDSFQQVCFIKLTLSCAEEAWKGEPMLRLICSLCKGFNQFYISKIVRSLACCFSNISNSFWNYKEFPKAIWVIQIHILAARIVRPNALNPEAI